MSNLIKIKPIVATDPKWWMEPINQLILLVNQLTSGHINSVGLVTLENGATQTTIMDNAIRPGSIVSLGMPQTAHAAAVTSIWVDPTTIPTTGGSVVVNHSSIGVTDATFGYTVFT
jgi:hypothetical protein